MDMDKDMDMDLGKEVDKKGMEKQGQEKRMMAATSAEKIVAKQRATAGWSKPSGEIFLLCALVYATVVGLDPETEQSQIFLL